jgi:hypothetical protein
MSDQNDDRRYAPNYVKSAGILIAHESPGQLYRFVSTGTPRLKQATAPRATVTFEPAQREFARYITASKVIELPNPIYA